jgi:hypothetical protein
MRRVLGGPFQAPPGSAAPAASTSVTLTGDPSIAYLPFSGICQAYEAGFARKPDEMVIAGFIAAVSLGALLPLFVSYCGTVLSSARKERISDRVAALTGSSDTELDGDDFDRVLELVRLCPEVDADRAGVRAVTTYYRGLQLSVRVFGPHSPSLAAWINRERAKCCHFAAVVLGRCISSSRRLLSQQAGDQL